jgi:hypothetical protein
VERVPRYFAPRHIFFATSVLADDALLDTFRRNIDVVTGLPCRIGKAHARGRQRSGRDHRCCRRHTAQFEWSVCSTLPYNFTPHPDPDEIDVTAHAPPRGV